VCSAAKGGLDPQQCANNLLLRFRAGGEKLRPVGGKHRRELSKLFQEAGVVPWMRDRIPLVYAGERLAAVADLWLEQDLVVAPGDPGLGLTWKMHPPLY
ncbi:MAG: tRNA lysidine(34) synthetase TilS, partial [Gammaproteobacteria bacterium]|nr:tRNA lysidine(34) synthetase TilS [Gammaproteobacteria bacterium]